MTRVAVVSSLYGGYDVPPEQTPQDLEASWTMVTDDPSLYDPDGLWSVCVEPRPGVHPRLAAKVAKCAPWAYADADVYVWVDASCRLLRPDSLRWAVHQGARAVDGIAQFRHPWRDCVYAEAEECLAIGVRKYLGLPLERQAAWYRERGHPEGWGLWATGLIVYTPGGGRGRALQEFGARWLAEQLRWTYQDQVSQPVLLRDMDLRPLELQMPGGSTAPLHGSGYVEWRNHRDDL